MNSHHVHQSRENPIKPGQLSDDSTNTLVDNILHIERGGKNHSHLTSRFAHKDLGDFLEDDILLYHSAIHAEGLKRLICDESIEIPIRVEAIYMLGQIGYIEALPELMEAGIHELSEEIRKECIGAIAMMKEKACIETPRLVQRLFLDDSNCVRAEVAKTLGEIGNPDVSSNLREVITLTVPIVEYLEKKERESDREIVSVINVIEEALLALFKLNHEEGINAFVEIRETDSDMLLNYINRTAYIQIHKGTSLFRPTQEEIRLYS